MSQIAKLPILLLVFIGIPLLAGAADLWAKAAKLTKIRVSQSTVNTRSAIIWVARAQGLFTKYGLDVETIYLQSSNLQTAALATGEVQIGNMGGATVLSGVAGGQAFRIVASPSSRCSTIWTRARRSKTAGISAASASASPALAGQPGRPPICRYSITGWNRAMTACRSIPKHFNSSP